MALLGGPSTTTIGTSLLPAAWGTVADAISDAALELGLTQARIDNPFASTDQNILQLIALFKRAGKGIVRERGWTHLQREYTFSTVVGQEAYPLPSDFREMISQSGWDRTTAYTLGGPVGAAAWQAAKAFPSAVSIRPNIRFQGGQISISPTPTAVQTIAFEYQSWSWIIRAGETTPTTDTPSAPGDVACFNEDLLVAATKLAWKIAKGMDTTTAQADFDRSLASEVNADASAPDIPLGGGSGSSPAQDVWNNVPQTGIGQ